MALEVHADHRVPLVLAGREHHAVAEEPGVVHEHVEAAEGVDRGVHEAAGAVPVGDVVGVGDGLAARRDDLVDDQLRRAPVGAGAVARDAEVVHDDARALTCERQRVLAADAARRAGDDDDPAVADPGHVMLLLRGLGAVTLPACSRAPQRTCTFPFAARETRRASTSATGERRDMKLEAGKVAVVTGAASGIGFALADRFATAGMHVVLADVDESGLAAAAEKIGARGVDTLTVRTDVSDEAIGAGARGGGGGALRRPSHVVCNNAGVTVERGRVVRARSRRGRGCWA